MSADTRPLSLNDLQAMKRRAEKIACLTAYDASFAALVDQAGLEVILVGDSLGMTMQGHAHTLAVTLADMVYHSRCVAQARRRAWLIADLPFLTYTDPPTALASAGRLIQLGGAQMVKLEGDRPEIIACLVGHGVPVCAHLGLLPQFVNQAGGFKVQGKTAAAAEQIAAAARRLQAAGAGLLVLECVPSGLASAIAGELAIPVIGIGAGPGCDGQVLVLQDLLGMGLGASPRFVKNFMAGAGSIAGALAAYRQAVKDGLFPGQEHSY